VRILSIQSHVAYGHAGNSAAVFPLQRLGHDVHPVLTVNFSNHTGYGETRGPLIAPADVAEEPSATVRRREVGGHVVHRATELPQFVEDRCDIRLRADAAEHQVPLFLREGARDAETDPARAAGHQRGPFSHDPSAGLKACTTSGAPAGPKNVRYGAPSARRLTYSAASRAW